MTKFLETLSDLLEEKGLRKADIVNDLNIPDSTVRGWWVRDSIPSGDICYKVAKYFNVSVEYLLTGKDEKSETKQPTATNLSEMLKNLMTNNDKTAINSEVRFKVAKHLESALSCLLTGEDKSEKSEIEEKYELLSEEGKLDVLDLIEAKLNRQKNKANVG